MNNNPDLLCIYHKNCADGFAAALAVKRYADNFKQQCEFIPAHYGDTAPDVTGKTVFIVDFSYPRETLLKMQQQALQITVIDHHKTAEKELCDLDFCIFDMTKSGAVLTWETLIKDEPVPLLFQYIQDRDLWRWKMKDSKSISAALQCLEHDFLEWEYFIHDENIRALVEQGRVILGYQNHCINKIIASDIPLVEIAGYTVPCINTTHLISEIGNELAKNHPFCALYFETDDSRIYSLRSAENGIDVSEIAKKFGGGGHYHAAGFKIKKPAISLLTEHQS